MAGKSSNWIPEGIEVSFGGKIIYEWRVFQQTMLDDTGEGNSQLCPEAAPSFARLERKGGPVGSYIRPWLLHQSLAIWTSSMKTHVTSVQNPEPPNPWKSMAKTHQHSSTSSNSIPKSMGTYYRHRSEANATWRVYQWIERCRNGWATRNWTDCKHTITVVSWTNRKQRRCKTSSRVVPAALPSCSDLCNPWSLTIRGWWCLAHPSLAWRKSACSLVRVASNVEFTLPYIPNPASFCMRFSRTLVRRLGCFFGSPFSSTGRGSKPHILHTTWPLTYSTQHNGHSPVKGSACFGAICLVGTTMVSCRFSLKSIHSYCFSWAIWPTNSRFSHPTCRWLFGKYGWSSK